MRHTALCLSLALGLFAACSGEDGATGPVSHETLTEVISRLASKDPAARRAAAARLGRIGAAPGARAEIHRPVRRDVEPVAATHHAVAALAKALDDAIPEVRRNAARSLRLLWPHATEAAPALAGVLDDFEPEVRFEAALALVEMGEEVDAAFPVLVEALADDTELQLPLLALSESGVEDGSRRDEAIRVLAFGGEAVGDHLVELIADVEADASIRRLAIEAFEFAPGPFPVSDALTAALLAAIRSEDEALVAAAALAVDDMDEAGRFVLPKLLELAPEASPALRCTILRLARRVDPGAGGAHDLALAALDAREREVRLEGLRLLAVAGPDGKGTEDRLRRFLDEDDAELRLAAADACWRATGDEGLVLPVCLAGLPDPVAVRLAGEIGPGAVDAVPALRKRVGEGDASSARSLGRILADTEVVPEEVMEAVESDDPALSAAAAGAAWRIRPELREKLLTILADGATSASPVPFLDEIRGMGAGAQAVVPVLQRHLDFVAERDPPTTWVDLAVTIAVLDPEAGLTRLVAALRHARAAERIAAARALCRLGPRASAAETALTKCAEDPSEAVRRAAEAALESIRE